MIRVICIAIGYVFGLFQTSYIYGRMHGIDIRNHGSGNAGTTNMLRTLGTGAGAVTFAGDMCKCILAVLLVKILFGEAYADQLSLLAIYTAAGVVLGHNFPFYLGFRGGKGIAATGGLLVSMNIPLAAVALFFFVITLAATHYVSLGSLLVYSVFMIGVVLLGQSGVFGMEQVLLNEMYVIVFLLTVLAFWMHRENIKRLMKGEERKTYLFKKKKKDGK